MNKKSLFTFIAVLSMAATGCKENNLTTSIPLTSSQPSSMTSTTSSPTTSSSTTAATQTYEKTETYTFGTLSVSITVNTATKVISAFSYSKTGTNAYDLAEPYKTANASNSAIVGKTVAEAQNLINNANTATSSGATVTANTYKTAMLDVLGRAA